MFLPCSPSSKVHIDSDSAKWNLLRYGFSTWGSQSSSLYLWLHGRCLAIFFCCNRWPEYRKGVQNLQRPYSGKMHWLGQLTTILLLWKVFNNTEKWKGCVYTACGSEPPSLGQQTRAHTKNSCIDVLSWRREGWASEPEWQFFSGVLTQSGRVLQIP